MTIWKIFLWYFHFKFWKTPCRRARRPKDPIGLTLWNLLRTAYVIIHTMCLILVNIARLAHSPHFCCISLVWSTLQRIFSVFDDTYMQNWFSDWILSKSYFLSIPNITVFLPIISEICISTAYYIFFSLLRKCTGNHCMVIFILTESSKKLNSDFNFKTVFSKLITYWIF